MVLDIAKDDLEKQTRKRIDKLYSIYIKVLSMTEKEIDKHLVFNQRMVDSIIDKTEIRTDELQLMRKRNGLKQIEIYY